jgi:hypothetical protein
MANVLLWSVTNLQAHVGYPHIFGTLGTLLQTLCSLLTLIAKTFPVETVTISFYDLVDENHMNHYAHDKHVTPISKSV